MKNKAMAYKPKDYIRKVKDKPIEKPADIGTKPVPSWTKKETLEDKQTKYYRRKNEIH